MVFVVLSVKRLRTIISRLLPRGAFARGVTLLIGGTAGAQALVILLSPILTRLYTPEDFGLLAVYGSLLALFIVVSSLRYELAIPLPEDDRSAVNITALCLMLVLLVAGGAACLVLFAGQHLANFIGAPQIANYLWLIPVGVLLGGCYNVFCYWGMRKKAFATVAKTRIQQSIAGASIQLLGFKLGALGLLCGQVANQSIGFFSLGRLFWRHEERRSISLAGIKQQAVRYKNFPIYSTSEGLFNTASLQVAPLMFAALFSPAIAGLYALSHRVLSLPMSLVGSAVGQVFFSGASEAHRQGRLHLLVEKLHGRLAAIGMPPALILILIGPDLFAFVFDENWRGAGEFARWMAPWLYLQMVSSPISTVFSVLEKQRQGLIFQFILLSLRTFAICFGYLFGDWNAAVIMFSLASAAYYFIVLLWIAWLTQLRIKKVIIPTIMELFVGIMCVSPLIIGFFLKKYHFGAAAHLYGFIVAVFAIFLRYFFLFKNNFYSK